MKKLLLILWLVSFFGSGFCLHLNEYRADFGQVVAVTDVENDVVDVVTVRTEDGNLWDFRGYGYDGGERCFLVFTTNGTRTIYDDEITGVTVR